MPTILLLETATDVCSVAIAKNGDVLALREVQDRSSHTAMVTLFIEQCVQEAGITLSDLDAVAVSKGPGSYTALRIGASVAKGLCYTLGKPLIAVSTLAALAWASKNSLSDRLQNETAYYIPMIDARRMEVYGAVYSAELELLVEDKPVILTNNLFLDFGVEKTREKNIVLSGNGSKKSTNGYFLENTTLSAVQYCSAAYLCALAEEAFLSNDFQRVSYFIPTYIKTPNITVSKTTHF